YHDLIIMYLRGTIVSKKFEDVSIVDRHRSVTQEVFGNFRNIHAFSVDIMSEKEWKSMKQKEEPPNPCLGYGK
ncbi:MAG: BolA-like protein 1, partial [Paramarteilia canceri]